MNSAENYGRLSRATKDGIKMDFQDEFLEPIDPNEIIIEKNPEVAKQNKGKCYGWNLRMDDDKTDCFDDIGFEWVGHQKYTMWDCRFNTENQDGLGRKTIYFHDLSMAKQMAIKYNANSITLTESGFSLRWGTRPINNPTHDPKKAGCGATGMGVWINKTINMDIISEHAENGAKLTDACCSAILYDCGLTEAEQEEVRATGKYEMIKKINGKLIWKKDIFGGVRPSRIHSSYKAIEEEMKKYKNKKTKKSEEMTEEFKAEARKSAKAHGARVEETMEEKRAKILKKMKQAKEEMKRIKAEEKAKAKKPKKAKKMKFNINK